MVRSSKYAAGCLLSVKDLSVAEVSAVLGLTTRLETTPKAERAEILAGRRIALLFYESSTDRKSVV